MEAFESPEHFRPRRYASVRGETSLDVKCDIPRALPIPSALNRGQTFATARLEYRSPTGEWLVEDGPHLWDAVLEDDGAGAAFSYEPSKQEDGDSDGVLEFWSISPKGMQSVFRIQRTMPGAPVIFAALQPFGLAVAVSSRYGRALGILEAAKYGEWWFVLFDLAGELRAIAGIECLPSDINWNAMGLSLPWQPRIVSRPEFVAPNRVACDVATRSRAEGSCIVTTRCVFEIGASIRARLVEGVIPVD